MEFNDIVKAIGIEPYYRDNNVAIFNGNCKEILLLLSNIDAIVTDPPYELGFMGKSWDSTGIAYDLKVWQGCINALKSGGHLLAFGGTRTYHRMACAIEDAGFEIRDMIEWVYGSGFPKSLNIGKAIDRIQGNERIKTGEIKHHAQKGVAVAEERGAIGGGAFGQAKDEEITKGTSEWEGWGTAMKPSHEPICMARKPIKGTVADNVLKYGTGGINIDGCRVEIPENDKENYEFNNNGLSRMSRPEGDKLGQFDGGWKIDKTKRETPQGRFPANLIHDGSEEVLEIFPDTGEIKGRKSQYSISDFAGDGGWSSDGIGQRTYDGSGSAARFFYCAKASKSERDSGELDGNITVKYNISDGGILCKEEIMVAEQLLQKVISGLTIHLLKDENGGSIMVQFHRDISSTILTEINKIIELKTLPLLMHSLTNEYTQDANYVTGNGGSLAESVVNLKMYLLNITNDNLELARGVSRVVSEMLLIISEKENWHKNYNFHATVKPLALMEYLIKLITPPKGIVLDPFMGSGSTLIAARKLGYKAIGIELNKEYAEIAVKRLAQGVLL